MIINVVDKDYSFRSLEVDPIGFWMKIGRWSSGQFPDQGPGGNSGSNLAILFPMKDSLMGHHFLAEWVKVNIEASIGVRVVFFVKLIEGKAIDDGCFANFLIPIKAIYSYCGWLSLSFFILSPSDDSIK